MEENALKAAQLVFKVKLSEEEGEAKRKTTVDTGGDILVIPQVCKELLSRISLPKSKIIPPWVIPNLPVVIDFFIGRLAAGSYNPRLSPHVCCCSVMFFCFQATLGGKLKGNSVQYHNNIHPEQVIIIRRKKT